jgi:hypothetical protein
MRGDIMPAQRTFLGEIELVDNLELTQEFGDFETLPNVNLVWELAREFSDRVEIMPYQKAGDIARILVSVYLELIRGRGIIIAVLARDPYPQDRASLRTMIRDSLLRLGQMTRFGQRYAAGSIERSREALVDLLERLEQA